MTRQQVRDAAAQVYSPEQIALMDNMRSMGNPQRVVGPIQGILGTGKAPDGVMVDAQGAPIRSLPAYNNAAPAYGRRVEALAQAADHTGIPNIGMAVRAVGAIHGKTKDATAVLKQQTAANFLSKLPPGQRDIASSFFTDDLLQHGTK